MPDATREGAIRLLGYSDLESAFDDPDRIGAFAGRIAAVRDETTLVVGAGDDTALGTLALLTDEGRAQARPFLEAVEPAADTFGNHDFDFGREWAFEWGESVPPAYLCANVEGPGTDRIPDATVVERGGSRIGVVGVSHPKTADICGTIEELRFTDPAAAVTAAFDDLPPVDYRVVLAHCGADDRSVAAAADADVVLGGHLHERYAERVGGTLLVRTNGDAEFADVTIGPDEAAARFHEVGRDGTPVDENGIEGAIDEAVAAEVAAAYRERREALGVDEVIAHADDELPRTSRQRFRGESRLGNFAADAFRAAAGADVGLFLAGSLRAGPSLSADVTVGEVVSLCPFAGSVVELEVSGAALRDVLAEAAHPHPGERGWVRLHVSGLRVVWTDANDLRSVAVGGNSLSPDRRYRVATAQYAVDVDTYPPLNWGAAVAEHEPQWETLVAHAREGGLDVGLEGRIRRVSAEDADRGRRPASGR
ncbi:5'-nucleotidase C-terminal domain-containing protein [Saliphagus infecundisoli]|uniref:5'-nucleotidase C-terminal domain-containing protein n=1 Tax=Saliphagus infecundisoli TaxID=1849069 RepID=A0ABD5QKK0_9EURY|nr:bifunctional metallophosphatase/5'-nucleotidase [Saliphagus infecundisoli]